MTTVCKTRFIFRGIRLAKPALLGASLFLAACAGTEGAGTAELTDAEEFAACVGRAQYELDQPGAPQTGNDIFWEPMPISLQIETMDARFDRVAAMVSPEIRSRMSAVRAANRASGEADAAADTGSLCLDATEEYSFTSDGSVI